MNIDIYKPKYPIFTMTNTEKKVKRFEIKDLKEQKDTNVTLKFNGETYKTFQKIMKEQNLVPSTVLNQFMLLTNDLLKKGEGGEVCFIFEENKKEESKK